jgi:HAE1 family hydrophobic/amphiphilic exporter-1/multidrug efflux pump
MGGMMAATFLAIFFVPLFFFWLTERKMTEKRSKAELAEDIAENHKKEHVKTEEGLV